MNATQAPSTNSERFRLLSGVLGVVTVIVGVVGMIYDDKLASAGIITAGLAITTHALA